MTEIDAGTVSRHQDAVLGKNIKIEQAVLN